MYVDHFQLQTRPFLHVPTSSICVMFHSMLEAMNRCCEGIDDNNGPVLVIGAAGCGKTTLLAQLDRQFRDQMKIINLSCATITSREELVQYLMFELQQSYEVTNIGQLRLQLIDHLKSAEHCPHGILLLVVEAHSLSYEVFEELRMISNLVCNDRHQVQLVIAGSRSLEEKLAHPQLDSLNQRIHTRCYLPRMTRDETMFFVLDQMRQCGTDGKKIFQPSALQKIHDLTDGVPRLVCQLADATLKITCAQNLTVVAARDVQIAWSDLQQLPMPENFDDAAQTGTAPVSAEGIIEFGDLSDEPPAAATTTSGQQEEFFVEPPLGDADVTDLTADDMRFSEIPVSHSMADELADAGITQAEMPVAEQSVAEQPVVEQPVAEQPVAEQPVIEQPVAEQPVAEQPVAEQPVVEQPVVELPLGVEPVVDDSDVQTADEPDLQSQFQSSTPSDHSQISGPVEIPDAAVEKQLDDLLKQVKSFQNPHPGNSNEAWPAKTVEADADHAPARDLSESQKLFGNQFIEEEPVIDALASPVNSQATNEESDEVPNARDSLQPLAQIPELESATAMPPVSNSIISTDASGSVIEHYGTIAQTDSDGGCDMPPQPAAADEIVVVSPPADAEPSSGVEESGDAHADSPNVGHVIRMDYRDLFEQLKNEPNAQSE